MENLFILLISIITELEKEIDVIGSADLKVTKTAKQLEISALLEELKAHSERIENDFIRATTLKNVAELQSSNEKWEATNGARIINKIKNIFQANTIYSYLNENRTADKKI